MTSQRDSARVHAFIDDALGEHDAVELSDLIRRGEVSANELRRAATARAAIVDSLNAIAYASFDEPRIPTRAGGRFAGIPTFVKDNVDVRGMPTRHGTGALASNGPARSDDPYVRQFLGLGLSVLGKSRLPEFGFNASTEFVDAPPTRNPWNVDHSIGASSGGAAALVATGVVPIAHANDGGGSIRIPAACAGLVGLKPSRGRHVPTRTSRSLPINMASDGILSRTVRDTAAFTAAMEQVWRNDQLPPVGLVEGPPKRRLRIGLVTDSVNGTTPCAQTAAAIDDVARHLVSLGHDVVPVGLPVGQQFADDFLLYWGFLGTSASTLGPAVFGPSFNPRRVDSLTRGLRRHYGRNLHRSPAALRRLRAIPSQVAAWFTDVDVVLSPVLAHVPPRLGHLNPAVPFEELMDRLTHYVAYTPLANVAGTPAISLPAAVSVDGVPIAAHFAAASGDERTLLELAFELEASRPFTRIQDAAITAT